MTATERPSLEARAREWAATWHFTDGPTKTFGLINLLEAVQSEERAFADIRLQTAVTTMEQATQAMLEAQAEVVAMRSVLQWLYDAADGWHAGRKRPSERGTRVFISNVVLDAAEDMLARPQPEAILRVLRAAVAINEAWGSWDRADAPSAVEAHFGYKTAFEDFRAAVRALPEGVREVLK